MPKRLDGWVSRTGARSLCLAGLLIAAGGLAVQALSLSTLTTVAAASIASAGLGALFVVAAVSALGHVAPEEAGTASGVLSTSHELGSSLGAAVMSGVAAASLVAGTSIGLERGYLVAALIAATGAVILGAVVPGMTER